MSRILVSLFSALATAYLAGCSVTSSLAPSFDPKTAASPENFLGGWVCTTDSDRFDVMVSPLPDFKNAVRIQIVQTPETKKADFQEKWVPLDGIFLKIKDMYFLTVSPAIEQMLQDSKYNNSAIWMLGRLFYLVRLTPEGDGYELRFVTFATPPKSSGQAWTPVGKNIKLHEAIVLNSTREIQEFLNNGEYRLDKTVYSLVRNQSAGNQGK